MSLARKVCQLSFEPNDASETWPAQYLQLVRHALRTASLQIGYGVRRRDTAGSAPVEVEENIHVTLPALHL